MTPTKPEDVFRAEKERSLTVRNSQHAILLAEAKAAFDKLMAEGQAARKSGRPRKHPLPPLKTSSSRPPVKPVAPPVIAAPVRVLAPATPAIPAAAAAPAAVAKTAKAQKSPQLVRAPAKPASRAKGETKRAKAPTKSKPKAKRSTKR